jgi:hypothetical protein
MQSEIDIDLSEGLCGGLDVLASLDPASLGRKLLLRLRSGLLVRVVLVLVLLVLVLLLLVLQSSIRYGDGGLGAGSRRADEGLCSSRSGSSRSRGGSRGSLEDGDMGHVGLGRRVALVGHGLMASMGLFWGPLGTAGSVRAGLRVALGSALGLALLVGRSESALLDIGSQSSRSRRSL